MCNDDKPTRVCIKKDGGKSETCIDHIFTNVSYLCFKALSVPVGCSDHNLVVTVRETKVLKAGQKIVYVRSMKTLEENVYRNTFQSIRWQHVLEKDNPKDALDLFNILFLQVIEKHAPLGKQTVGNLRSPWLDAELKELVKQRDEAKQAAILSSFESDWQIYRKLRNYV